MNSPTEPTQGEIQEILRLFLKGCTDYMDTSVDGYIDHEKFGGKATEAIFALLKRQDRYARADELNTLSYMNARNDWHNDSAYKLWEYVAGRQAELKSKNEE